MSIVLLKKILFGQMATQSDVLSQLQIHCKDFLKFYTVGHIKNILFFQKKISFLGNLAIFGSKMMLPHNSGLVVMIFGKILHNELYN